MFVQNFKRRNRIPRLFVDERLRAELESRVAEYYFVRLITESLLISTVCEAVSRVYNTALSKNNDV